MKKILLVLTCIVAMAMMIVGCGGSDKKDAAKGNDKKITVGFSVSTQNNPFFVSLAKGVEAKAKELGVTVVFSLFLLYIVFILPWQVCLMLLL